MNLKNSLVFRKHTSLQQREISTKQDLILLVMVLFVMLWSSLSGITIISFN